MNAKLKSSQRIQRRYLLLEANKEVVEKALLEYLGILGWAKAVPVFVSGGKDLILSVSREELSNVRAAFELCSTPIKVRKVSGTLAGLRRRRNL